MTNFKRTLKQRVKSIIRAAKGKNLETLTLGVEIKHCSDCNKLSVADKETAKVKMIDYINDFFGCDAAYFDVNPYDLATHLLEKGCAVIINDI